MRYKGLAKTPIFMGEANRYENEIPFFPRPPISDRNFSLGLADRVPGN